MGAFQRQEQLFRLVQRLFRALEHHQPALGMYVNIAAWHHQFQSIQNFAGRKGMYLHVAEFPACQILEHLGRRHKQSAVFQAVLITAYSCDQIQGLCKADVFQLKGALAGYIWIHHHIQPLGLAQHLEDVGILSFFKA